MGVQNLQSFVETSCPKAALPFDLKDLTAGRSPSCGPAYILVDVLSCLKFLYGPGTDWVCGGQWNEMLRNVENFVRSFRQLNIELIAYFDGGAGPSTLHEWIKNEEEKRQQVHQVLVHLMRFRSYPGKKLYVPPSVVGMCLRLAFQSCGVTVCSSVDELREEMVSYYRSELLAGIVGYHADFILLRVPRYLSAEHLKFSKKSVTTVRFDPEVVFKELDLHHCRIGLFASLLGSDSLPEEFLAPFHWSLIEPDHPLSQQNQPSPKCLFPPNDATIKNVLAYTKQFADVSNLSWIAGQVFRLDNHNKEDLLSKLNQSVHYYNQANFPFPASVEVSEQTGDKPGYPVSEYSTCDNMKPLGRGRNEHQYQKMWQHWQQHQQIPQPLTPTQALNNETTSSGPTVDTPDDQQVEQALSRMQITDAQANTGMKTPAIQPMSPPQEPSIGVQAAPQVWVMPTSPPAATATSPTSILPTPPPSVESSPMTNMVQTELSTSTDQEADEEALQSVVSTISQKVLQVTKARHQSGVMSPFVLQVLTKGEVTIGNNLEDEHCTDRLPAALLFRPIRQYAYGVLYNKKAYETKQDVRPVDPPPAVKEWCVYKGKLLNKPDLVQPLSMGWDIPKLDNLWLSVGQKDDANRLKAFLTCMKSDIPHMTQTSFVPQRLIVLCCIMRYLLQQSCVGRAFLHPRELDAFLAQALSPHLTTDCNASNLGQIKLNRVEMRGVQLASIFMRGVETASFANDACGAPIPYELVCPWNYFDGKLFHSKFLMAADNASLLELCDGKNGRVEKLQRMRWCITESLNLDLSSPGLPSAPFMMPPHFPGSMTTGRTGDGLLPTPFFGPVPPAFQSVRLPGSNFGPPGFMGPTHLQQAGAAAARGRGVTSKRPVSGLGGTLEVAGVPIAQWSGNKAGRGYSEKTRIVVGGQSSVELGHQRGHRRGRGGARARHAGSGARSVTWAMDVDRMYDRSIGYHESPQTSNVGYHEPPHVSSIGQVREGGDGGNEMQMDTRERGDGANDVENHHGEHVDVGQEVVNLQSTVLQPTPLGYKGQNYSGPLHDVTQPVGGGGVDMAPVILGKTADSVAGLGRGHGVTLGGAEQLPLGTPADQSIEGGGRGRGWWWEKQVQQ